MPVPGPELGLVLELAPGLVLELVPELVLVLELAPGPELELVPGPFENRLR